MDIYKRLSDTAGVQALGMGLLFILHALLARILGAEHYGIYVYIMAWINVAAILGKFGTDRGMVRLISRSVGLDDFGRVTTHMRWGVKIVTGFTLLAAAIAVAVFGAVEGLGRDEVHVTGSIGLLVLFAVTYSFLQKGALLGLGAAAISKIPTEVLRPVFMILGILLLAALMPEVGAQHSMWLTLVTYLSVIAVGHAFWQQLKRGAHAEIKIHGTDESPEIDLHDFSHFVSISVSYAVMRYTDVLLLGAIAGPVDVAFYSIAARLASLVVFVQRASSPVVQPIISRAFTRGQMDGARQAIRKVTLVTVAATLVIAVILVLLGRDLLGIFGSEFRDSYVILVVLLVGQVTNALAGPNAALLSMTDNQRIASRGLWAAAILNIIGNMVLIPQLGALGAATATAVATFAWNALLIWACVLKLNFDPSIIGLLNDWCRRGQKCKN